MEQLDMNLYKDGVCVVPIPNLDNGHELVLQAVREFPEYKNNDGNLQYVFGSFGGLGNPSAFHHPNVRLLRQIVLEGVKPLFKEYLKIYGGRNNRIETIFDGIGIRSNDYGVPSKNSWHTDTYSSKYAKTDEPRRT